MKIFWRFNFIIHVISGFFIFIVTIVLSIMGIKEVGWAIMDCAHCALGLIVLLTVSFIVFGGMLSKYMLKNVNWRTQLILKIKLIHGVRITIPFNSLILVGWSFITFAFSSDNLVRYKRS